MASAPKTEQGGAAEVIVVDLGRFDWLGRARPFLTIVALSVLGILLAMLTVAALQPHMPALRAALPGWREHDVEGLVGVLMLAVAIGGVAIVMRLMRRPAEGWRVVPGSRRSAPPFGRSLADALTALEAALPSADATGPPKAAAAAARARTLRAWSRGLAVLPVVVAASAAGGMVLAERDPAAWRILNENIVLFAAGFILLAGPVLVGAPILSMRFYRRARALEQASADAKLAADPRPPALYLRAFEDDGQEVRTVSQSTARGEDRGAIGFEDALSGVLDNVGPLVAIGAPGEPAPSLGAAKAYFSDDEWQAAVLRWIDEARIVVVGVGLTPWVGWEVGQILEKDALGKTLFLFPPQGPQTVTSSFRLRGRAADRDRHMARVARLETLLAPAGLGPDGFGSKRRTRALIAACRLADGRFLALTSRRAWEPDYHRALALGVYGLLLAAPSLAQPSPAG